MQKRSFAERYTDRSFVLTVIVLGYAIYASLHNIPMENVLGTIAAIAPFVLGEKHKDAAAASASKPSAQTGDVSGDVSV